jgi:hypothetical protein
MKLVLTSAAALSFLFCAAGGIVLLAMGIALSLGDAGPLLAAAGLFIVGCGIFLGAILFATAQKCKE